MTMKLQLMTAFSKDWEHRSVILKHE
jgi:hypothetical protein